MSQETFITKEKGFPLRLYPPIWFMLFAAAALVANRVFPLSFSLVEVTRPLAMCLALTGGLIALWAAVLFRWHETTAHPYADASRLVTGGPYRYIRNPMYLGLLLLLIAIGFWLQSLSALLLSPLFVFVINRCNILPEEQRLMRRFGENYRHYHARTRRWI
jgi:protein-S-isoprenylcysteine O-methyltransferase Ste14